MAKILVVDDDDALREILCDMLRGAGHQPVGCAVATDALALADEYAPELAVLDYSMPGMTGTQLLASIRKHKAMKSLPVIFLSGTETIRFSGEVPSEPRVRFLSKPLDFPQLEAAIAELLSTDGWWSSGAP